jgi:WD40 repeat protein
MKKVLLFIFFALGIVWVFIMASLVPRRNLPENSQWQLPKNKNAVLNTSGINDIQYSPDGTRLAVASSIGVWLYDMNSDKEPALLTTDIPRVFSVSFSPDGKTLATGCEDGFVRLWDVNTAKNKRTFIMKQGLRYGEVSNVLFNRNGDTLMSSSIYEINLWDVATNTHKQNFSAGVRRFSGIAFNADGMMIAGPGSNNTIHLLDAATREEKRILKGHTKGVKSVAFSLDGSTLASGSWDKTVRLWDVATGRHKRTLKGHRKSINSITFSADGQLLATASRDETVRLWDATTGKQKKTLKGHIAEVVGVSFSPDRRTIVSWSNDRTIRLWDVGTGKFKKALQYPKSSVTNLIKK